MPRSFSLSLTCGLLCRLRRSARRRAGRRPRPDDSARPVCGDGRVLPDAGHAHGVSPDRPRCVRTLEAAADRVVGQRRLRAQRVGVRGVPHTHCLAWLPGDCDRGEESAARHGCGAAAHRGTADRRPHAARRRGLGDQTERRPFEPLLRKDRRIEGGRDGTVVRRPAGPCRVARSARDDERDHEQRRAPGNRAGAGRDAQQRDQGHPDPASCADRLCHRRPDDIAYPNAEDDFARITAVPVFKANLNVGHGGTYRQPGGGWFGEVAGAGWTGS